MGRMSDKTARTRKTAKTGFSHVGRADQELAHTGWKMTRLCPLGHPGAALLSNRNWFYWFQRLHDSVEDMGSVPSPFNKDNFCLSARRKPSGW